MEISLQIPNEWRIDNTNVDNNSQTPIKTKLTYSKILSRIQSKMLTEKISNGEWFGFEYEGERRVIRHQHKHVAIKDRIKIRHGINILTLNRYELADIGQTIKPSFSLFDKYGNLRDHAEMREEIWTSLNHLNRIITL